MNEEIRKERRVQALGFSVNGTWECYFQTQANLDGEYLGKIKGEPKNSLKESTIYACVNTLPQTCL